MILLRVNFKSLDFHDNDCFRKMHTQPSMRKNVLVHSVLKAFAFYDHLTREPILVLSQRRHQIISDFSINLETEVIRKTRFKQIVYDQD